MDLKGGRDVFEAEGKSGDSPWRDASLELPEVVVSRPNVRA